MKKRGKKWTAIIFVGFDLWDSIFKFDICGIRFSNLESDDLNGLFESHW